MRMLTFRFFFCFIPSYHAAAVCHNTSLRVRAVWAATTTHLYSGHDVCVCGRFCCLYSIAIRYLLTIVNAGCGGWGKGWLGCGWPVSAAACFFAFLKVGW
jgi:hypothetical protein